ncbi:MAG: hypothetical protein M5U25_18880 [Planctomycetota bacterium]|nr:hypothetical protein [Planctomycetota bacterium]
MSRKIAALRVLCERRVAKRFQETTKGMKAEQISLHLQSVLAAALVNPGIVVAEITKGRAMALQVGGVRGSTRPVLLALPCNGQEERETFRRLVMALTHEVSALVTGPVLPDASTVVRALIAEWLKITTLEWRGDQSDTAERIRGSVPTKKRNGRSPRRRSKPRTKRSARTRRKKHIEKKTKSDLASPHPDFPDVSAKPIDWRPGRRGRPPRGAVRRRDGSWTIPKGFRVIQGKVHPPLTITGKAVSLRKTSPTSSQKDRHNPAQHATEETGKPDTFTSEAEVPPQPISEESPAEAQTEKPSSSDSGTETSSGEAREEPP